MAGRCSPLFLPSDSTKWTIRPSVKPCIKVPISFCLSRHSVFQPASLHLPGCHTSTQCIASTPASSLLATLNTLPCRSIDTDTLAGDIAGRQLQGWEAYLQHSLVCCLPKL